MLLEHCICATNWDTDELGGKQAGSLLRIHRLRSPDLTGWRVKPLIWAASGRRSLISSSAVGSSKYTQRQKNFLASFTILPITNTFAQVGCILFIGLTHMKWHDVTQKWSPGVTNVKWRPFSVDKENNQKILMLFPKLSNDIEGSSLISFVVSERAVRVRSLSNHRPGVYTLYTQTDKDLK